MNIFARAIKCFEVEETCCYYLLKYVNEIFKERDSSSHMSLISKSCNNNEMLIICKELFLLFIYSPNNNNFFNERKKYLVRYYSKDLKEKIVKTKKPNNISL